MFLVTPPKELVFHVSCDTPKRIRILCHKERMNLKTGSRPILFDNKKLSSLTIAVRSAKAKNYAENINYYFFVDGKLRFIFFFL